MHTMQRKSRTKVGGWETEILNHESEISHIFPTVCVQKMSVVLERIENLSAVVVLLVEFFWNMVLGFRVSQKPF